jgi:hypothetical protein
LTQIGQRKKKPQSQPDDARKPILESQARADRIENGSKQKEPAARSTPSVNNGPRIGDGNRPDRSKRTSRKPNAVAITKATDNDKRNTIKSSGPQPVDDGRKVAKIDQPRTKPIPVSQKQIRKQKSQRNNAPTVNLALLPPVSRP